ncbi:MAG: hypothetical protein LBG95_09715 [Treponema sp.]|jgi:hypothetical protein|nr:hypothetical protein [Treponema sp.]
MNFSQEWQDIKYNETFEEELRGLERRRAADHNCAIADIEGTLKHLYIMDGSDWGGRGGVQDAAMAATIAAYEHFIAQWKSELPSPP